MNTIVLRSASRSLGAALVAIGARLWARTRFALRRFAALYAEARIRQAALEIRRFEACHRPLAEREGGLRSRLADDVRYPSS
jgi:hypothetical protein